MPLSTMAPLGFSKNHVRETVEKLLKEYGENKGWQFIKSDSYDVVINAMHAEKEKHEETNNEEVNTGGRNTKQEVLEKDIVVLTPNRERKLCYGWITDGSEDVETILLRPALDGFFGP